MKRNEILSINAQLEPNGFSIIVENKTYAVKYPTEIWNKTPLSIRQTLLENLTFGNTHYLPLILGKAKIVYNTALPVFESYLFRNQLCDLLSCEKADSTQHLSYIRDFYNLEFEFASHESTLPDSKQIPSFSASAPTAVLPFTFGKESLATLGLCFELGIKPIVVYSQEPSQPYEEKCKRSQLVKLQQEFDIPFFFIKHEPGLFRYGKAFNKKTQTEVGWGTQTTLLALLVIPFVFFYQAKYILIGSEFSNNEYEIEKGWRRYLSYDQTSFWTQQQNNIVRQLTNDNCQLKSSLEPLEEINIFYILHHRYPQIGKYQFSCNAERPLVANSQWCHLCYKCTRMFLFSLCCNVDPFSIGFKRNMLAKKGVFNHYFDTEKATGSTEELDFAFYLLYKKGVQSSYIDKFVKIKLPRLKPWSYYYKKFTTLQSAQNLPPECTNGLIKIFSEELANFKQTLPPIND